MKLTIRPVPFLLAAILSYSSSFAQINNELPAVQQVKSTQVLQAYYPVRTEKGADAFNTQFNAGATGRNNMNAYLLAYLSTAIYADKITELERPDKKPADLAAIGDDLQMDSRAFTDKFKKVVSPYFSATTQYKGETMEFFEETSNFDGYDPEAMIIPADNAIFVTIRGTDRVGQRNNKGSIGYKVQEWIQTDFQAFLLKPTLPGGKTFAGQVHQGMWLSIAKIADRMAARIVELGGATKKVWITGHSLGAGQAQLFAYYLAKVYNIKAQGVYAFAAPQVGNADFYADLIAQLGGKARLQRFEFIDDPVTGFALNIPAFKTGGTRVFYNVLTRETFDAGERTTGEILRMSLSTGGVIASLGGMCYHTQNWYMQAALKQLTATEAAKVPASLPVPDVSFMACGLGVDIARAMNENPIVEGALDIADALLQAASEAVAANISQLSNGAKNLFGMALKDGEGKYRIKCLKEGKYLNVDADCYKNNSCKVMLWRTNPDDNNELFEIKKQGFGYDIKVMAPNTDKVLDVTDKSTDNNALVQTYDRHWPGTVIPNNQIWYFIQIGTTNRYILQNERSGKVLEATDPAERGTRVRQSNYVKGDASQIWVLEKN